MNKLYVVIEKDLDWLNCYYEGDSPDIKLHLVGVFFNKDEAEKRNGGGSELFEINLDRDVK